MLADTHARQTCFAPVLLLLALGLLGLGTPASAAGKVLTDFSDDAVKKTWVSVNDTVMGGVSKGGLTVSDDNTLVFSGKLSLENRGGFASIRTRSQDLKIGKYDSLAVKVKGDGRTYYLDLRTPSRRMASSYRTPIKTVKGEWTQVRVPLSEFYYTSFGRKIDRAPIKAENVSGIGFTLADKKAGPFRLEIAWVKAVNEDEVVQTRTKASGKTNPSAERSDAPQATGQLDIVGTAAKAGQFKTLLAAAKAAGLVDALKNPDANLTVFAPTDEAFAALPKGTVESLLKPENKGKLVAVLAYHVLPTRFEINQQVKTLQGGSLDITTTGKVKVGEANVIAANIKASNGVIHVIDRVLIPTLPEPSPKQKAMRVIELAIDRGVPIFNAGQIEACAAIYEVAVTSLITGHADALSGDDMKVLTKAMQGLSNHSARDQAWTLREAMDKAYTSLSKRD